MLSWSRWGNEARHSWRTPATISRIVRFWARIVRASSAFQGRSCAVKRRNSLAYKEVCHSSARCARSFLPLYRSIRKRNEAEKEVKKEKHNEIRGGHG